MFQLIFQAFFFVSFSQPSLAYQLFQSKYPAIQPVIEACQIKWPDLNIKGVCALMLRCTIDGSPSDYPARWSAGASILAFIPTIVGLMSNSVDEVTAVAEESKFLAIAVSLSSVTTFSSRLGDKITSVKLGYQDVAPEYLHAARESILELINSNTQKHSRGWRNTRTQDAVIGIVLIGASTSIWYELFQVTRYGIVTFACPVKVNVLLWAALGQTLTLLSIFLRCYSYEYRKIHIKRWNGRARRTLTEPTIDSPKTENQAGYVVIVLRCLRSSWQRRALQLVTAVLSFSIYTFGTTVLASMTLFEAADALRVVVIVSVNAGLGRVVGYWAISSIRKGKKAILIDVSAAHIDRLSEIIGEEF